MKERTIQIIGAAAGAVCSFFTGLPPVLITLLAVMTMDYVTGILTGVMGKSSKTSTGGVSSKAAFQGLMKKIVMLVVVALAYLLDFAVSEGVGIQFAAVSGACCLWFIASEGISIVENAAQMGVPIPEVIRHALEIMRGAGEKNG